MGLEGFACKIGCTLVGCWNAFKRFCYYVFALEFLYSGKKDWYSVLRDTTSGTGGCGCTLTEVQLNERMQMYQQKVIPWIDHLVRDKGVEGDSDEAMILVRINRFACVLV